MFARASRTAGSAALTLALFAAAAGAQPVADAQREGRARFVRGVELFERGNSAAALAEFLAAYALAPRPSVLFNLAATYEALHRYPEATEAYERFLASEGAERRDRAHAERSLARIRPLLATIRVSVSPPGASLRVDDAARAPGALAVSPGEHVLVARWPDGRETVARVVIASAQTRDLALEAPPAPQAAPAPPPAPTLGRLRTRGLPRDAVLHVDGALFSLAETLSLPLGTHTLRVEAEGRLPWQGAVQVTPRGAELWLSLATPARGPAPALFWGAVGASAAMLVGAAVTGGLALSAHDDFSGRTRDDPAVPELARRGDALSLATDGLLLGALVTVTAAVILGTQTSFSTPRSSAALREVEAP